MGIGKIGRIVRAAGTDADIARRTAGSSEFRRAVTKDRRSALSRYTTVKDALRDRARIVAAKGAKKPRASGTSKKRT